MFWMHRRQTFVCLQTLNDSLVSLSIKAHRASLSPCCISRTHCCL
jgi:hypothetical protein